MGTGVDSSREVEDLWFLTCRLCSQEDNFSVTLVLCLYTTRPPRVSNAWILEKAPFLRPQQHLLAYCLFSFSLSEATSVTCLKMGATGGIGVGIEIGSLEHLEGRSGLRGNNCRTFEGLKVTGSK